MGELEPVRVHGELVKLPVPVLLKSAVPVGAVGVKEVSVTIIVQVVAESTATEEGAQFSEEEVAATTPYTPLTSGIPVILFPLVSKLHHPETVCSYQEAQ